VTHQGLFAQATGRALALQALGRQRDFATGQTIQLDAARIVFLIRRAMRRQRNIDRFAFRGRNAHVLLIPQKAFFAKTTRRALTRAPGFGQRHGARGRASRSASAVFLVRTAFWRVQRRGVE